ncbi:MAG TPA: hypothetical protein PK636_07510, partial [bacterium]|nr:hypothetical protein [bacterium]
MALAISCLAVWGTAALGAEWTESTHLIQDGVQQVKSLAALDDSRVWAGVQYNNVYFYDGAGWELQTSTWAGETMAIYGLCAVTENDVWMAGKTDGSGQGRVYYFDGSDWELQTELGAWMYCVYAPSDGEIFAAGASGVVIRSVDIGASWSISTDSGTGLWMALGGLDASHVWAVGDTNPSRILFWDGSAWSEQTRINLGSSRYLRGVWAKSDSEVWAAGDSGYILRFDGSEWAVSTVVSGGSYNFGPVAGTAATQVWAGPANTSGNLFFWDGASWSVDTVMSGSREPVSLSTAAYGSTAVWMGTENAHIFRYLVPSPTPELTASPTPSPSVTPTPIYVS